jgi:hypothetical protein
VDQHAIAEPSDDLPAAPCEQVGEARLVGAEQALLDLDVFAPVV